MGGKSEGGGVILNKNIKTIHQILYVLFHVRDVGDTLYECNAFNTIYVGDVGDTLYECNAFNTIYVRDVRDTVLFL